MLSYLHGYHAGNAADVLKSSVLIFCLNYLRKKETPLLCVDTHAGAGCYELSTAGLSREWEKGIGRLAAFAAGSPLPPLLGAYVDFVRGYGGGGIERYPGSPVITRRLLGKGDRLVCFELHPGELRKLRATLAEEQARGKPGRETPSCEARGEDGPGGLRALLPPPSRRGLVFVDPAWEEQSEYESVPRALGDALRRFPGGCYIVWYPLLARPREKTPLPLSSAIFGLSGGKRCRVELYTGPAGGSDFSPESPRGMYGSGLVIFNPPWILRPALEEALPCLAETLGGTGGGWRLDWEE